MDFYAFGESLIDIITNNKGEKFSSVGGSLVNTSVSLARSGRKVFLITDYGKDEYGNFLKNKLIKENIDFTFSNCFDDGNTALAFAQLDEESKAHYTFHKKYPQKRFVNFTVPSFNRDSCLLFGSFSALTFELQDVLSNILNVAKNVGSLVFYDPNVRKHCLSDDNNIDMALKRNFQIADIIKVSDEDLENLLGSIRFEDLINTFELTDNQILIITKGSKGVSCYSKGCEYNFEVPKIEPISTIGAGDNFNAGILNWLALNGFDKSSLQNITDFEIEKMIEMGITFATEVCMSKENYIAKHES